MRFFWRSEPRRFTLCVNSGVNMYEKHGATKDGQPRLYRIWRRMRERCRTQPLYAARGISVCEEWNKSFVHFRDWALANGYHADLSIDRIDGNGPYSPENCRWATPLTQSRNRRPEAVGLAVTHDGQTLSLLEWSRRTGIYQTTLYKRYHKGLRGAALFEIPRKHLQFL